MLIMYNEANNNFIKPLPSFVSNLLVLTRHSLCCKFLMYAVLMSKMYWCLYIQETFKVEKLINEFHMTLVPSGIGHIKLTPC